MHKSRATIAATRLEGKMGAKDNIFSAHDCILMNMARGKQDGHPRLEL